MDSDIILNFVKVNGPILPIDLKKQLKLDTMFAGAYLADLTQKKKILISNIKIGTSPLYYVENQKEKLQGYYEYLDENQKQAYDLLKKEFIIKDEEQKPLLRASLRLIPDFAVPIYVNYDNKRELFFKWFLLDDEKVQDLIRKKLEKPKEVIVPREVKVSEPEPDVLTVGQENPTVVKHEQIITNPIIEPQKKKPTEKKLKKKDVKQKELEQLGPLQQEVPLQQNITDSFCMLVKEFLSKNNIEIHDFKIVEENKQIDLVVSIPSVFGKLKYYCYATAKKRCSEGDLSFALIRGQLKNLPTLFISPGELTKKGVDALSKDLSNIVFKRIE